MKKHITDNKDTQHRKAKGVPKKKVKTEMNFALYKETLEHNTKQTVTFNSIRSYNHQLYSITCCKTGLSNYENKRYYVDNNVSYPYGHYKITQ